MSTFGGVMLEFPDIRVDYFRQIPGRRPPLACFLSHIHSDHLTGLDTLKSPFVYCSSATKELLLRLERYPHRLNFALGKLESRKLQYKHLKNLLKPIPLETPTRIELEPGNDIQVTLFDANHCIGAVMFLIESNDKAVLYTGDIRSEPWFVNNLTRNPFLIEYTSGLKTLDCIYLDTSNTQPLEFPTKADGLKELLQKVSQYPADAVFHLSAWTFGYEEVWMALSRKLNSPIHVDNYKLKLYQSLRGDSSDKGNNSESIHVPEGPVLAGYRCGNTSQLGCLTSNTKARIHSCEKGMRCEAITENTIWIRPIVTRNKLGVEIAEAGVGGGGGDLSQRPELEFDSDAVISQLLALFANMEDDVIIDVKQMLLRSLRSNQKFVSLDDMGLDSDQDDLRLTSLGVILAHSISEKRSKTTNENLEPIPNEKGLPKVITFPYSRHSSYSELCSLVSVFNPKDIYPCTSSEDNWSEEVSMKQLFGKHCSATTFRHDTEMRELQYNRISHSSEQSQMTDTTGSSPTSPLQRVLASPAETTIIATKPSQASLWTFDNLYSEMEQTVMIRDRVETPPAQILALSPGSESQNRRRRAILDGLTEERVKRARIELDFDESSPSNQLRNGGRGLRSVNSREDDHPSIVDTNTAAGRESSSAIVSAVDDEVLQDEENVESYWDPGDQVYRCRSCGYELWSSRGACAGCSAGEEDTYFELLDPDLGPRPGLTLSEYDINNNIDVVERAELLGDCLDFDSSAYDSQDEKDRHDDVYEVNSFIDDDSLQNSQEEDDDASSDEEIDYKEKFQRLQTEYSNLLDEYCDTLDAHEEFKRDIMGSDYESIYGSEEFGEDGMVLVDVTPPDPVVTELVLSQSEGQSQEKEGAPDSHVDELVLAQAKEESQKSEVLAEREDARAEAYDAALDGRWHDVSLVSTSGNHTYEEVEM